MTSPDRQPPQTIPPLTPAWFDWWRTSNLKTWSTGVTTKGLGLNGFEAEDLKTEALDTIQSHGRILERNCVGREKAKILDRLQSEMYEKWETKVKTQAPKWFIKKCMRLALLSAKAGHTRSRGKRKCISGSEEESYCKRSKLSDTASPPPDLTTDEAQSYKNLGATRQQYTVLPTGLGNCTFKDREILGPIPFANIINPRYARERMILVLVKGFALPPTPLPQLDVESQSDIRKSKHINTGQARWERIGAYLPRDIASNGRRRASSLPLPSTEPRC